MTMSPRTTGFSHTALAALALIASFTAAGEAAAAEMPRFARPTFEASQAAGRSMVVWVHAPWCSVCRTQGRIINEIAASPEFENVAFYELHFDRQQHEWARLGVTMQSTLIVFRRGQEVGRAVGIRDRAQMISLLRRAL